MKDKIRSYGFWTALAGALVVVINAIGKCFGFSVEEELVSNIVMAIAGVLVVFGVVTMPKKEGDNNNEKEATEEQDTKEDIEQDTKEDKED